MQPKTILAVDPGFDRLGIAVMSGNSVLFSECIVTNKKSLKHERLCVIGTRIRDVIKEWRPQSLAIEALFFSKNTTSALGVAEARGVILYEASRAGLKVFEYNPQSVKIAVTGYGKADKSQVERMVRKLITQDLSLKKLDDEIDAIALGITHLATQKGI